MLPTLALIKNERVTDYVVGLDELGGTYDFETGALETRLAATGVIFENAVRALPTQPEHRSVRQGGGYQASRSDEDSDFE